MLAAYPRAWGEEEEDDAATAHCTTTLPEGWSARRERPSAAAPRNSIAISSQVPFCWGYLGKRQKLTRSLPLHTSLLPRTAAASGRRRDEHPRVCWPRVATCARARRCVKRGERRRASSRWGGEKRRRPLSNFKRMRVQTDRSPLQFAILIRHSGSAQPSVECGSPPPCAVENADRFYTRAPLI
jgi:hypothetical protein